VVLHTPAVGSHLLYAALVFGVQHHQYTMLGLVRSLVSMLLALRCVGQWSAFQITVVAFVTCLCAGQQKLRVDLRLAWLWRRVCC
jgi:hypothetical protein